MSWSFWLGIALLGNVVISGCSDEVEVTLQTDFPYDLTKPDQKAELPKKLTEISGLAYLRGNRLACVQDEDGKLFIYNMKKKKISSKFDFGKDADYEGIAFRKDTFYVIRSNGTIVRISGDPEDPKTKKFATDLKEKNNTEGLCLDDENNRLLVALKDSPGKGKALKHKRSIYAFDLVTNKLSDKPVITIDLDQLATLADDRKQNFKPSGIAIHPKTKDIYVIATVGKLLVVLRPDGTFKYLEELPEDVFKQPEGITFNKRGDLFISNEGRSGKANILRFKQL